MEASREREMLTAKTTCNAMVVLEFSFLTLQCQLGHANILVELVVLDLAGKRRELQVGENVGKISVYYSNSLGSYVNMSRVFKSPIGCILALTAFSTISPARKASAPKIPGIA